MASPVASNSSERIGDLLVREGLITKDQLDKALQEQRQNGTRVGYNLVKLGFIQEIELTKMLARQYKMPAVDLSKFEVDPKIVKLIPADLAVKNLVLPLKRDGRTLTVAMADPTNFARHRRPQVHHALRHLPGHRGRVHAPQRAREDLRVGRRPDVRAARRHRGTRQRRRSRSRRDQGRGSQRDRARRADGRGAGREADQRAPHRRRQARRQRHPLRVLRARASRALSHRRRARGDHEAAQEDAGGARLAVQDHVVAQHRRASRAAGRPHQAEDGQESHRLSRVDAPDAVRREGRAPNSRQGQPDARPREVRHRAARRAAS